VLRIIFSVPEKKASGPLNLHTSYALNSSSPHKENSAHISKWVLKN
jgi:hypothetical protein